MVILGMDVAQSGHVFQPPMGPPPSSLSEKSAILQQQSVIQTNQQLQQQLQSMHDNAENNRQKSREILTRRPSYRKILDDLAADSPVKMENYDDNGSSDASSPGGPEELTDKQQQAQQQHQHQQQQQQAQQQAQQQYQSIQLNGVIAPPSSVGGTVVQLNDGQAYTIKGSLPVGLESATLASPQQMAEEATRKRELRLYKNREAARECRRKKKEYVKCLENRVAVLENQNKALIEELKSLKDLYCSKGD
eukprot:TCONS_00011950-protein